jgi:hypothetical protein
MFASGRRKRRRPFNSSLQRTRGADGADAGVPLSPERRENPLVAVPQSTRSVYVLLVRCCALRLLLFRSGRFCSSVIGLCTCTQLH